MSTSNFDSTRDKLSRARNRYAQANERKALEAPVRPLQTAPKDGQWVNVVFKCRWNPDLSPPGWDQIPLGLGWIPAFPGDMPDHLADALVERGGG